MAKKEKPSAARRRESEPTAHHENHHADAREAPTPEPQDQPEQFTVFTPPHPGMNIYRVLKTAYREYHGSAGAVLTVTTPPTHAANTTTTVAGTLEVDAAVITMPASVSVDLIQGGVTKATQSAPVAAGNPGAYTTTFPVSVCAAGTATARVSAVVPAKTATTPAFTLT